MVRLKSSYCALNSWSRCAIGNISETSGKILFSGSGRPLHLIVITSKSTLTSIATFLLHFVGQHLSSNVIQRRRRLFPPIFLDFVDIEQIVEVNRPFFEALKNTSGRSGEAKYAAELFYIAPLYHQAFTSLDKMAVIDSTDLEFFDNIEKLFDQFDLMSPQALVAIGRDLSPHYRSLLSTLVLFFLVISLNISVN